MPFYDDVHHRLVCWDRLASEEGGGESSTVSSGARVHQPPMSVGVHPTLMRVRTPSHNPRSLQRALNATLHPIVRMFLNMGNERMIQRYVHRHPRVNEEVLRELLKYQPGHFRWGGCDLFACVTGTGSRKMVVVETNSCPSGQKSMPLLDTDEEMGGWVPCLFLPPDSSTASPLPTLVCRTTYIFTVQMYSSIFLPRPIRYRTLMERTFRNVLLGGIDTSAKIESGLEDADLAVIYDKNKMETGGYAVSSFCRLSFFSTAATRNSRCTSSCVAPPHTHTHLLS